MYTPDGTPVDGPDPVSSTVDDLRALYANDPSLILQSYFYYVEVKDGKAVEVDQGLLAIDALLPVAVHVFKHCLQLNGRGFFECGTDNLRLAFLLSRSKTEAA